MQSEQSIFERAREACSPLSISSAEKCVERLPAKLKILDEEKMENIEVCPALESRVEFWKMV